MEIVFDYVMFCTSFVTWNSFNDVKSIRIIKKHQLQQSFNFLPHNLQQKSKKKNDNISLKKFQKFDLRSYLFRHLINKRRETNKINQKINKM